MNHNRITALIDGAFAVFAICGVLALCGGAYVAVDALPVESTPTPRAVHTPVPMASPVWMEELPDAMTAMPHTSDPGPVITLEYFGEAVPFVPVEVETETEAHGFYRADIPLSADLQAVLYEICSGGGVDFALALGLIQTESSFDPAAVSPLGDYGLCQLCPMYFPSGLSPEDNLREGIGYLGRLLARYGDTAAALTAYHVGHDDGTRTYAGVVLDYAREWGYMG